MDLVRQNDLRMQKEAQNRGKSNIASLFNCQSMNSGAFHWQCISCMPLIMNAGHESSQNISYVHNRDAYSNQSYEFNLKELNK